MLNKSLCWIVKQGFFMNNGRIYKENIELKPEAIKNFWFRQAAINKQLNSVLLGSQTDNHQAVLRNKLESSILHDLLKKHVSAEFKLQILDLGCGLGRWYCNFKHELNHYIGTDFSADYVQYCQHQYKTDNNDFLQRDLCSEKDIAETLSANNNFNLIIITGVLMYLNDSAVRQLLSFINEYACIKLDSTFLYIQESTAWKERLTLSEFPSKELKSTYNAIYRTNEEYLQLITENLPAFSLLKHNQFLTEKNWPFYQKDSETYTKYFFLGCRPESK